LGVAALNVVLPVAVGIRQQVTKGTTTILDRRFHMQSQKKRALLMGIMGLKMEAGVDIIRSLCGTGGLIH